MTETPETLAQQLTEFLRDAVYECSDHDVQTISAAIDALEAQAAQIEALSQGVAALSFLPSFLAGWQLSDACKRNEMGPTVQGWLDGLAKLNAAMAAKEAR
jgi:hypothetical protein